MHCSDRKTPSIVRLTHNQIYGLASRLAHSIHRQWGEGQPLYLYPIPRGGVSACYALTTRLFALGREARVVDTPEACNILIDDIIDSGETRDRFMSLFPDKSFAALLDKTADQDQELLKSWVIFPWESEEGSSSPEDIPRRLLQFIGEDPTREGLKETPKRVIKAWKFWCKGYQEEPKTILKVFKDGAEKCDNEMILVRDIPVYSHCEHHLAPFFGVAHIAYIPNGKIVGLSKLNRLVDAFGRRLQVQERLTNQVADTLYDILEPQGSAVVISCRHLCMESRGIQHSGCQTVTSALRGAFKDNLSTRQEFYNLINGGKNVY